MVWIKMVRWSLWDPSISGTIARATTECVEAVAASAKVVSASVGAVSAKRLPLKLFAASAGVVIGIFS